MRVLHVLDHSLPVHSGYTFRTRALLREQARMGIDTLHLTSSKHPEPGPDPEEADGLLFHRTAAQRGALDGLPGGDQLAVVRDLRRSAAALLEREPVDLVHVHSPCLNGLAVLPVAKRHRVPLVYEMRASWEDAAVSHGSTTEGSLRYRVSRALETRVLRRADGIVTICEGLRDDIAVRGIPRDRVTVVGNGVDIDAFTPERDRSALPVEWQDCFVLGFLGSFYAYEGLACLVDAMARLRTQRDDVRVLLFGGGPEEGDLRARVAAADLDGHIRFMGRVPHAEVPRWTAAIDGFVFPRLPIRLTEIVTPLKPLEAMASGGLVLASDVGGHRELVRDGETGVLFAAGDAGALAGAISDLADADQTSMREAARAFVAAERSWPRQAAAYAPLYERLVGRSLDPACVS